MRNPFKRKPTAQELEMARRKKIYDAKRSVNGAITKLDGLIESHKKSIAKLEQEYVTQAKQLSGGYDFKLRADSIAREIMMYKKLVRKSEIQRYKYSKIKTKVLEIEGAPRVEQLQGLTELFGESIDSSEEIDSIMADLLTRIDISDDLEVREDLDLEETEELNSIMAELNTLVAIAPANVTPEATSVDLPPMDAGSISGNIGNISNQ